jgi:hypothetical protein
MGMTMPFGKYKGEALADIPGDYLQWVLENCTNMKRELAVEIRNELAEREDNEQALNMERPK